MKKIKLKKLKLGFDMDIGAPMPHVLANEHKLYLLFYKALQEDNEMMLIKFNVCIASKFVIVPNHSNVEGYPYYTCGLWSANFFEIKNSDWIEELKKIDSFTDESHTKTLSDFKKLKHYVLLFHDSTFECVAESFKVKKLKGKSMTDILSKVAKKLN